MSGWAISDRKKSPVYIHCTILNTLTPILSKLRRTRLPIAMTFISQQVSHQSFFSLESQGQKERALIFQRFEQISLDMQQLLRTILHAGCTFEIDRRAAIFSSIPAE